MRRFWIGFWFALAGYNVQSAFREGGWWILGFLAVAALDVYLGILDMRRYAEEVVKERDQRRPTVPAYMLASRLQQSKKDTEAKHGPGSWDVADVLTVIRETGERSKQ